MSIEGAQMASELQFLLGQLTADPWRAEKGFSAEVAAANEKIFSARTDDQIKTVLAEWLAMFQPCLFGRIAAKRDQLAYCVLTEGDLKQDDQVVRDKIQTCRRRWTAEGYHGRKSGFIVFLVSPIVTNAVPDEAMLNFARRLATLYLLEDVITDRIYLDELFLDAQLGQPATWRWSAGVNYFSAHGDGRWWADHRIPAGMAFSVNSVGHMAKSGQLAAALNGIAREIGLEELGAVEKQPVSSLLKGLELAMMTIDRAAITDSGKATVLLPLPNDQRELPVSPCPVQLPKPLADRNYCTYGGYYNTDVTLPSEYFRDDVKRPEEQGLLSLDFTYLFDDSLDNPEYIRLGTGLRIREPETDSAYRILKRRRSQEETAPVEQNPRLAKALREFPE
jgi:hypothetical protein